MWRRIWRDSISACSQLNSTEGWIILEFAFVAKLLCEPVLWVLCLSWFLTPWGWCSGPGKRSRGACYCLAMSDDNESGLDWPSASYVPNSSPEWPHLILHWHSREVLWFLSALRQGHRRLWDSPPVPVRVLVLRWALPTRLSLGPQGGCVAPSHIELQGLP